MSDKIGHVDKWGTISAVRKRAIRAEMLGRWKQKLRKKGAAKVAGADVTKAGGTGSMAGFGLSALERDYAKTVRKTQKKKSAADVDYVIPGTKKTKKAVAKTARTTGAGNVRLVDLATKRVASQAAAKKMKSVAKGGTVGLRTHTAGAARREATAWRKKHMTAAGGDKVKRAKIAKRFRRMIGAKEYKAT